MDTAPPPARWRGLVLPAAIILALAALAWSQRPDGRLHLYIPATPGDTALIQTPAGRFALIDGGRDPAQLTLQLGRLMPFWRRDLRAVILTGAGGQRLPGQVAALARYWPHLALAAPDLGEHGFAGEWRRQAAATRATALTLAPGQRLALDGATLSVLAAEGGEEGGAVLLLTYGATRVLFHTGGPRGDTAARAAHGPLDLLLYPWQRDLDTGVVATLRPRSIVFTEAYEAPSPALLSYAARRRFSPRIFHPDADGQIELVSDGRRSWLITGDE